MRMTLASAGYVTAKDWQRDPVEIALGLIEDSSKEKEREGKSRRRKHYDDVFIPTAEEVAQRLVEVYDEVGPKVITFSLSEELGSTCCHSIRSFFVFSSMSALIFLFCFFLLLSAFVHVVLSSVDFHIRGHG